MLYKQTIGTGKDLVLLHGWGFSSALFTDFVTQYQHQYRITLIDLPGHGKSGEITGGIEQWCAAIIKILPHQPILLGWSLGGLLAIQIASQIPVHQLILLGSSPNFIQNQNWDYGIVASHFEQFYKTMQTNTNKGLKRFVSLQSQNKTKLKKLNQLINDFPATAQALNQGLKIMLNTDLTHQLQQLKNPTQVILGTHDVLVPITILAWYSQHNIPAIALDTGHLPFLHSDFSLCFSKCVI